MDIIGGAKREILHMQADRNFSQGNYRDALEHYLRLFDLLLESGDDMTLAQYDERIGDCYNNIDHHGHKEMIDDHKKAAEHFIKAASRYRKIRQYDKAGLVFEKGAKAFEEFDNLKDAALFYHESAKMFMEVGDFVNASYAFFTAAQKYEKDGDFDKASNAYQYSALSDLKIKDTANASISFKKAAANYQKSKLWEKALDTYANSIGIDTTARRFLDVAETYENMANCQYEKEDYKNAVYYYTKAAELRITNDDIKNAALNLRQVGDVYKTMKDYSKAIEFYLRSSKAYFNANSPAQDAMSVSKAARVYETMEQFEQAANQHLEAAKSNRVALNEPMARDAFIRAAQMYVKAAETNHDNVAASALHMKAALAYSDIKDVVNAANEYNSCASLLYDANRHSEAQECYKKAALEYVKGGMIGEAAEAFVNQEDYANAADLYDKFAERNEQEKDEYGGALGYLESANCYRRLEKESLMKSRLDRALALFGKALEHIKAKDSKESQTLIGDAFRKMAEAEIRLNEYEKAQMHLKKAQEAYLHANEPARESIARAFLQLVEGIKAIDYGYYPKAEEMLASAKGLFDEQVNSRGWKKEYTKILAESAAEAEDLIEKIKLKPEVELDIDRRSYTFAGIPVILNVKLNNNGKYTMKQISFLEHLPEEIKLTKLPDDIASIEPGNIERTSVELTPTKTGFYRIKPIEVYYEDQKTHKYVKASNEISLEVVEFPPTDYKNYTKAVDVFQKYADSQENNQNWFQAGDGYRQMAEAYGKFRADEALQAYFRKAVDNYGKYVADNFKKKHENKAQTKRLADACWYFAEGCRNLKRFDEAVDAYDRSVPLYNSAGSRNLANRSSAFKLKVDGTRLINIGDYAQAETTLRQALDFFDDVVKTGGIDEDTVAFIEKNEDEVKNMLELIRNKPDISLLVECPTTSKRWQDITLTATMTNPQKYPLRGLKPVLKVVDGIELLEKADNIDEIAPGQTQNVKFKMRAVSEGHFKFKPLDVIYQDNKGNAFMRGSNEVIIDVIGQAEPPLAQKDAIDGQEDANLQIDVRCYTFAGQAVMLNLSLTNRCQFPMKDISFLEHLPDEVKLAKLPERIAELKQGETRYMHLELNPSKTGTFRIRPVEVYYQDPKAHKYVKASNEIMLEVVEKPPADYKNFATAVEMYQRYAQSQEANRNWFQAADGYRQMADVYRKFKSDENVATYYGKAVEGYMRYVRENQGSQDDRDKTAAKRLADAFAYAADAQAASGMFSEAADNYDNASRTYKTGQLIELSNRATALKLKVKGVLLIRSGDYSGAEQTLNESLGLLDLLVKAGGFDDDGMRLIEKNEDEIKGMLSTLKAKPDISVVVTCPAQTLVGEAVTFNARINNQLDFDLTNVRATIKPQDGVQTVEEAKRIESIGSRQAAEFDFRLKLNRAGEYRFSPLDISYMDNRGNSYMKAANEVRIRVDSPTVSAATKQAPAATPTTTGFTPSVTVDFGTALSVQVGQETEVAGRIVNDGSIDVNGIRFVGNSGDEVEVLGAPTSIEQLPCGAQSELKIRIKAQREGTFQFKPVEFFYKDMEGKRFFKSSNELTIKARRRD
jgi:tetratricopeptide (TPR) repeat protein